MKILFIILLFMEFTYAKVIKSGLACSSIENLKKINFELKTNGNSLDNIYKYSSKYKCEILNLGDKIKITSSLLENKYYQIKLSSKNQFLHCNKNSIKVPTKGNASISGSVTYSKEFRDKSKAKDRIKNKKDNK